MKIAIVGMGVAGAYLASRLADEHEVIGFDRLSQENFDAVCAWGTSKPAISQLVKQAGLNFEDYMMHEGRVMFVDTGKEVLEIKLKGLCCFDKLKLIQDLGNRVPIQFGKNIHRLPQDQDFDLVIDATGLSRPLLPRLQEDVLIPCVQYKVKYRERPFDDFYIKPFQGLSGYFWFFPLDNGYAHVGAGDFHKRHLPELNEFLRQHPCEVIKKVGRPVRITPPTLCGPFVDGKVVGVGESIGTVFPLLGEGIIPSMQCADLMIENLGNWNTYREKVLSKFRAYEAVYRLIKAKIDGRFSLLRQIPNLLAIYLHMKSHETRYGLEVHANVMRKIIRV